MIPVEDEQKKLREEINQLTGLKSTFDLTLKSKSNEVDNLTCQLESSIQRMGIRDQRINELSLQLAAKTTEENNSKSRLTKITEKLDVMQVGQLYIISGSIEGTDFRWRSIYYLIIILIYIWITLNRFSNWGTWSSSGLFEIVTTGCYIST